MKYLAYYDVPENKEQKRNIALSAATKISYITQVLEQLGEQVQIVSASMTTNPGGCDGKSIPISDNIQLTLFPCVAGKGKLGRVLSRALFKINLFWYLLRNIKKNENVIVYHSVAYAGMVALLRKLRKFNLILEVEELYSDVSGSAQERKKENKVFAAADKFLFSADRLNAAVNHQQKPYGVLYGTYKAESERNCRFTSGQDKIHCVYAGTLDPRKGGGVLAAQAAQYLPEQYHIHILGFGAEQQVQEMRRLTEVLNEKSRCTISYDGCLTGEEYICFLQSCHIGLSTQNPNAAYNDTSFPSKILTYMANGLQVVTVRIPVVEESGVNAYMHYYDDPTPEMIAKAIIEVETNGADGRAILQTLEQQFTTELKNLLGVS